jgi:hypothetical protein
MRSRRGILAGGPVGFATWSDDMLRKADEAHESSEKTDQQSEHRDNQGHCTDSRHFGRF